MKNVILSIAFLLGILMVPSCSDITTKPEEPNAMYFQVNGDGSYAEPEAVGERPNRDSVKKDTTDRKRDTTTGRKDTVKKAPPTIFGDLLNKLNLGPDQNAIVERLLAQHKACVEECVKPLKAAEAEILAKARKQEAEIKKAVEAGTITKAQARVKLAALKANVNKALKSLPVRRSVQECIKACDATFINGLERILSADQKIILKSWLDSRAKRGTSGKKDTTDVKPRG
jgi:hypothetical protein